MSRILVTGAGGFVGQFVALGLHQLGFPVLATGRSQQPPGPILQAGIGWISAELSCANDCRALLSDCHWVIHCAGRSSPVGAWGDFARDNLAALRNLMAASSGVQGFIYLSSSGVYFGDRETTCASPRRESDPLPERYPEHYRYVWSKRIAEEMLRASSLPWIIIRPRAIYGPGDRSLFPRIQSQLLKGRLPILGDGRNLTSLTHVQHLLDLMVLLIRTQSDIGQSVWNICDGPPVELWGLFREIAKAIGAPPLRRQLSRKVALPLAQLMEFGGQLVGREPSLTRYTVNLLSQTQTLDISKAQELLGFRPRYSSLEAVLATVTLG